MTRVVQWATGSVGRAELRALIEAPDYDLVGVLVYDPAKAGRDAGELCGLEPTTGVLATTDKEAIIAMGPDVVIHAASKAHAVNANTEDICRLLAAGSSVITTTSYNHLPTYGADVKMAIEAACAAGGSRFHATGENPGFMFERLAATLTGLSKTVDRIDLYEVVDASTIDSRPMIVDLMGMGRSPADVTADSPIMKKLDKAYQQALNATADVLGVVLDNVRSTIDCTTVAHDIDVAVGTIEAGTVVGQRMSWIGRWADRDLLAIHEEWVLTRDLPQWGMQPIPPGERVPVIRAVITGDPTFELGLSIGGDEEPGGRSGTSSAFLMIGMAAVRAIPYVLAAPPGIVTAPVFGAIQLSS